jgi:hypothetical protein
MNCTGTQIEFWLRGISGWVPDSIICQTFQVNERRLRWDKGKPGILSECAISHSQKGFKHIANATAEEFHECDRRDRKASLTRLLSLRRRRQRYQNEARPRPMPLHERRSGQGLLFELQPREDANVVHH